MKGNPLPRELLPPVVLLTSAVYLTQGALGIAGVAFPLFLRGKGWGIAQVAQFSSLVSLPWALKIVYGALTDSIPICGSYRKAYLVLAGLLSMAGWAGLSWGGFETVGIYLCALTANLGFAMTDVVTDAVIVEHSTRETTSTYQSVAWGFRGLGAVLGGVLGGWLAQNVSYSATFGITALLPLFPLGVSLTLKEFRRAGEGNRNLFRPIVSSVRLLGEQNLKWFVLVLLASSFSAALGTPFFFFLKETLGFSEQFLGGMSSLAWLGAMGACFFYGQLFRGVSLKKALYFGMAMNVLNILSTLAVRGEKTAALVSVAGGVISYLTLLPMMGAAAVLSRQRGLEGSLFALLMSLYNLGQILSGFVGGNLFGIIGLRWLVGLSAGVSAMGFLCVKRLKGL